MKMLSIYVLEKRKAKDQHL